MSLWNAVCSVLLCFSVRNRTHPPYEMTHKQLAGEAFLSQRVFLSLTELTDLTERFLRTVSNPQNASGIQISQNVTAKEGCWVMSVRY